eukprot:119643_1
MASSHSEMEVSVISTSESSEDYRTVKSISHESYTSETSSSSNASTSSSSDTSTSSSEEESDTSSDSECDTSNATVKQSYKCKKAKKMTINNYHGCGKKKKKKCKKRAKKHKKKQVNVPFTPMCRRCKLPVLCSKKNGTIDGWYLKRHNETYHESKKLSFSCCNKKYNDKQWLALKHHGYAAKKHTK